MIRVIPRGNSELAEESVAQLTSQLNDELTIAINGIKAGFDALPTGDPARIDLDAAFRASHRAARAVKTLLQQQAGITRKGKKP